MVKGVSLVALRAYWKNHRVKIQLALAKGKASHDKRQDLKKREDQRDIDRAMAHSRRQR
jgi:SsrA-binding protein